MSPVKFCPEHGPYDASFASCPQCGGQPAAPRALDDGDALETDITPAPGRFEADADATYIPQQAGFQEPSTGATMINSDISRQMDETQLSGSKPAMVDAVFWVKEGNRRGKFYPIRHNTVIGRKEGNLILDDFKVSGTHAKVTVDKKHYMIWDFGSSNGTFVNGKRISEATPIDENDEIAIGDTVFVLKLLAAKKKKPVPAPAKKKSAAPKKKAAAATKKSGAATTKTGAAKKKSATTSKTTRKTPAGDSSKK